ncbi:MAG: hypothetical protein ACRC57_08595 [Sarcina sp.]
MNFKKSKYSKLKPIIAIGLAIIVPVIIYLGTYYYKISKTEINNQVDVSTVVTDTLTDDIIISFSKKNLNQELEVYHKLTIGELKKDLNVDSIKESDLTNILEDKGFQKIDFDNKNLSFEKIQDAGLKSNKYYIGDKDGYIAIFKTDQNGVAFIEKQSDITNAQTENYPKPDIDKIKGFERVFETREECEDALADYTG